MEMKDLVCFVFFPLNEKDHFSISRRNSFGKWFIISSIGTIWSTSKTRSFNQRWFVISSMRRERERFSFDDLDNVLSILNDISPPTSSSPPPPSQALIDLAASSNSMFVLKFNYWFLNDEYVGGSNSAANELDDLFGSLQLTKVPSPPSSSTTTNIVDPLDDCLPLFPTTNVKTNPPPSGSSSFFVLSNLIQCFSF